MISPSDREIRLLHLLPGTQDDTIRCAVRVVSLDEAPAYEALSYVWGERVGEVEIQVGDQIISITRNLHAGLRRLRHPSQERALWIDQLCINQENMKEKAAQVALMRDIYQRCSQCIIWMGEIGEDLTHQDAEYVFDFLQQVAAVEIVPITELPMLFRDTRAGEAARRAFAAFAMYGNAWWSRIWTVQEAIIPHSSELIWGPLAIRREVVLGAARNIRKIHQPDLYSTEFVERRFEHLELLRRLLYPVHGFIHSRTDGTADLLLRWRHREATDPRDKVYALLGLIRPGTIPSAQLVDYSIIAPVLFARVTVDLMKLEGSLRPLLAASEMPHTTASLPTWAIDFASSNRVSRRQMKWWNHSHRYREFSACKDHTLQIQTQNEGTTLSLAGTYLDEVLEVSDVLSAEIDEDITPKQLLNTISNFLHTLTRYRDAHPDTTSYSGTEPWITAFWRTLLGDLSMDEYPLHRIGGNRTRYLATLHEKFKHDMATYRSQPTPRHPRETGVVEEPQTSELFSHMHRATLDESLTSMLLNHAFFITRAGYMGIGPPGMRAGDQVWIFYGGNVPFVMRGLEVGTVEVSTVELGNGDRDNPPRPQLTLVGDSYVHGVMDGEFLDDEPVVRAVCIH